MSDHTAVALEVASGLALACAVTFVATYICLSRFIQDTTP